MKNLTIAVSVLATVLCCSVKGLSQSAPVATPATLITTTSFFANWTGQSAAGFYLDVSTQSFFPTYVTGYQSLLVYQNGSYVTGLSPGKTYYYRVRNVGSTTYSNVESVTLLPDPALVAPVATAATNVTSNSMTANWNSVADISSYGVDVATNSSFSPSVISDRRTSSTSMNITGLASNVTYYYRVRSVNSNGSSSNSNVISSTTPIGPPAVPSVSGGTQYSGNPVSFNASWGAVGGAIEYRLDVSRYSTFETIMEGYDDLQVIATSQSVTGLSLNTTYYYRVRAVNLYGTSGNSSTGAALTSEGIPSFVEATDITTGSFVATWHTQPQATGYRLDVSSVSDLSSLLPGYSDLPVTETSALVTGLARKTTYYFRVRAVYGSEVSESSLTASVTTGDISYVRTVDVNVSGVQTPAAVESLTVDQRTMTYGFVDGLGRTSQTVSVKASPLQYDIVQPVVYDAYGREAVKYLPYVASENNGWYKPNPVGTDNYSVSPQAVFYNSGSTKIAQDAAPYSKTEFETNPLNRVLKQGAPGAAWQPNEVPESDHSVKKAYEFNGENEVILFTYDETTEGISASKYHEPNRLYANKTTDEHNHEVIEYVDKEGRTVLKKVQYEEENGEKHYAQTYYIYDVLGNLVVVLPPEASAAIEGSMDE